VPLGLRQVDGRDAPPERLVVSEAYRRLMGWEHLDLTHQHVVVTTEDGPCAGLLLEVAGDDARVMMVRHEDGTLMETWVDANDVTTVRADPPVS